MKRMIFTATAILFPILFAGCSAEKADNTLPEKHFISYEDDLSTLYDLEGADSFEECLDSADSRYYVTNDYYNMESDDTLHIISNFETYQQTTEYTCGPAALKMVLHYYGIDDYDELELAEMAGTDDAQGTSPEGICQTLDAVGLTCESHMSTDAAFSSVEEAEDYFMEQIDAKLPVLVDWEDWGGHWQVVIGIDTMGTEVVYDDVVILADPYDVTDQCQDGYYTYPLARFVSMWREGACAGKTVPYEQPYVTVVPEKAE